jgi:hypothetical protein
MDEASTLVTRFPATLDALTSGRISRAHAAVIADAGARLIDDDARAAYETAVLPVAERETVGRLRPIARRLADALHPTPIDERHRDARRQRRVWVCDRDDGIAELGLTGPAHLVHGVYDRLTQLARAVLDAPRPQQRTTRRSRRPRMPPPRPLPTRDAWMRFASTSHSTSCSADMRPPRRAARASPRPMRSVPASRSRFPR